MPIIKRKHSSLNGIKTVAILADPACRGGWERNFPRLLKKVRTVYAPDMFLVAGDLALNAYDHEYKTVLKYIEAGENELWAAVPGDHDRPLKYFRKYFGSIRKVLDIGQWRFIGVNTSNRMFLKREADWIQDNIEENTVIFSHVPPEASGWTFHSLWPISSGHFLEVIKKYQKQIKAMFFGHIHGYSRKKVFDIPLIVTGSAAESKIIKNNKYNGLTSLKMVIFDVETGKMSICALGVR